MGERELSEEIENEAVTMLVDCGVTQIESGWSPVVQFVANVSTIVHRRRDARIEELEQERGAVIAVLDPNMPESGPEDAARQVIEVLLADKEDDRE